jgi:hypothetical protein
LLAGFTWALATFTAWLWWDTKTALDQERTDAADDRRQALRAFNAVHRPKLRIRAIKDISAGPGKPTTATIVVVNTGDTNANIHEISADFFVRDIRTTNAFGATSQRLALVILAEPGVPVEIPISGTAPLTQWQEIQTRTLQMCCVGAIKYRDGTGAFRNTGFFRVYDPSQNVFVRPQPAEDGRLAVEMDYED